MTAKEYLGKLEWLDVCIKNKIQERQLLYSSVATTMSGTERVQSSKDAPGAMAAKIERIEAVTDDIDQSLIELLEARARITGQINGIHNALYCTILHERFVNFRTTEEIAAQLGYTRAHVQRVQRRALMAFEAQYAEELEANGQRK